MQYVYNVFTKYRNTDNAIHFLIGHNISLLFETWKKLLHLFGTD